MESDLPHTVHPSLSYLEPKYVAILKKDPELMDRALRFAGSFGVNSSQLIDIVGKSIATSVTQMIKEKYPDA
jgi:hypothetical protein